MAWYANCAGVSLLLLATPSPPLTGSGKAETHTAGGPLFELRDSMSHRSRRLGFCAPLPELQLTAAIVLCGVLCVCVVLPVPLYSPTAPCLTRPPRPADSPITGQAEWPSADEGGTSPSGPTSRSRGLPTQLPGPDREEAVASSAQGRECRFGSSSKPVALGLSTECPAS
jgi:hypothetical protein